MKACTLICLSALVILAESLYSQQAVFPVRVGDRWEEPISLAVSIFVHWRYMALPKSIA